MKVIQLLKKKVYLISGARVCPWLSFHDDKADRRIGGKTNQGMDRPVVRLLSLRRRWRTEKNGGNWL